MGSSVLEHQFPSQPFKAHTEKREYMLWPGPVRLSQYLQPLLRNATMLNSTTNFVHTPIICDAIQTVLDGGRCQSDVLLPVRTEYGPFGSAIFMTEILEEMQEHGIASYDDNGDDEQVEHSACLDEYDADDEDSLCDGDTAHCGRQVGREDSNSSAADDDITGGQLDGQLGSQLSDADEGKDEGIHCCPQSCCCI